MCIVSFKVVYREAVYLIISQSKNEFLVRDLLNTSSQDVLNVTKFVDKTSGWLLSNKMTRQMWRIRKITKNCHALRYVTNNKQALAEISKQLQLLCM